MLADRQPVRLGAAVGVPARVDVQGRHRRRRRSTPAHYTPDSIINGNSPITVSGVPLENDGNQSWGPITLTKALTYSVNTVFAQVGEKLGIDTMATYMKRFGFYSTPPLDFPKDEMAASGEAARARRGRVPAPTSA